MLSAPTARLVGLPGHDRKGAKRLRPVRKLRLVAAVQQHCSANERHVLVGSQPVRP